MVWIKFIIATSLVWEWFNQWPYQEYSLQIFRIRNMKLSKYTIDHSYPFCLSRIPLCKRNEPSTYWEIKPRQWSGWIFGNLLECFSLLYKFVICYIHSLVYNGIHFIPSQTNMWLVFSTVRCDPNDHEIGICKNRRETTYWSILLTSFCLKLCKHHHPHPG